MLLDRIDIDAHGPLSRVELGPFAEHLNVVCGPEGSGKTAIARFVRDSLVNRRYPLGMMSSSTGRVVWADRNGMVHCRREQDGTPEGRRTIEFETRGSDPSRFDVLRDSWIEGANTSNDATRAAASIQLPESIVDCVITDTAITNVARVVSACIRNGLDSHETYRTLPLAEDRRYVDRNPLVDPAYQSIRDDKFHHRELRAQLADVEAELAKLESSTLDYESLIARRNAFSAQLSGRNRADFQSPTYRPADETHRAHPGSRLATLSHCAETLRRQQSELRRWIKELDTELGRIPSGYHPIDAAKYRETIYRTHARTTDSQLRQRLSDLDAQMIRWRRTLMEVRGLRDALLGTGRPTSYFGTSVDEVVERRRRLDNFLHSVDRFDREKSSPSYSPSGREYPDLDAYQTEERAEDIEARIDAATRQIDWLLQRYTDHSVMQDWYRSLPPETGYRSGTTLTETLRAIRHDLQHVADATRHQHSSYRRTQGQNVYPSKVYRPDFYPPAATHAWRQLNAADRSIELGELNECERWLVAGIDQLIGHRRALLNSFAADESTGPTPWNINLLDAAEFADERARRLDELEQVTSQLESCLREMVEVRRSPGFVTRSYDGARASWHGQPGHVLDRDDDLSDESIRVHLRQIDDSLAAYSRLRWLRQRREQLLDGLRVVRRDVVTRSPLADEASRWLVRLSAGKLRCIDWDHARFQSAARKPATAGGSPGDGSTLGSEAVDSRHTALTGVRIDGRDEANCLATDRALAVLAVRLAAGDLLARLGRAVPLVIETQRELLTSEREIHSNPYSLRGFDPQWDGTPLAFYQYGDDRRSNHPIAAALHDYSRAGRQVVVLTSDTGLTEQITRSGGRAFNLHTEHIVHPHRPIWRPQYAPEKYAGPHPHTYGDVTAADYRVPGDRVYDDRTSDRGGSPVYHGPYAPVSQRDHLYQRGNAGTHPVTQQINRSFDVAWREAYGLYDNPEADVYAMRPPAGYSVRPPVGTVRTDWPRDDVDCRDGYFFRDAYTTVDRERPADFAPIQRRTQAAEYYDAEGLANKHSESVAKKKSESPFFLTVDSPIDQAPSVDAVAAARLRGLGVTHINHLMQQDSNRLSDALGLANVDAATIRRWQSECRLVCRVPQLRGFDARVLVGSGITDPAQLAGTAPVDLLNRVEAFLATKRGQRILLSGSSYELSRITSWIASANNSVGWRRDAATPRKRNGQTYKGNGLAAYGIRAHDDFDRDRYEHEDPSNGYATKRRRRRVRTVTDINRDLNELDPYATNQSAPESRARSGGRSTNRRGSGRTNRSAGDAYGARKSSRSGDRDRTPRRRVRIAEERDVAERQPRDAGSVYRSDGRTGRSHQRSHSRGSGAGDRGSRRSQDNQHEQTLRFYLQRGSDVVDAPSIGARMAERLNAIGIYTVDDLLQSDPESVASSLDHRRIDADTVLAWQQQATLVCRVPMLRGHDAQLLVVAEVTSPEELASYDAEELFALIDPVSRSREGKRILRGGNLPDLEEITDWVGYAQHHRELMAA